MRQVAKRFRLAVAIVIAMVALIMGAGHGLPGLVTAMSGSTTHVCTCASGGDHASCPVCNATATAHRSARPAAQGVPCGDPRVAVGTPGEASMLPAPLLAVAPASTWIGAPRPAKADIEQIILEPSTPPPRRSAT
jgi:hypothetical protein